MRRFEFSLQIILELRERRLLEVRKRLALKRNEIAEANERILKAKNELQEFLKREVENRSGYTSAENLKWSVEYRFRLKRELLAAGRNVQELNKEAEEIRKEAVEAERKKRTLEILKDKRYQSWLRGYRKKEQEAIDDATQKITFKKS
ncbi:MAG: flagellar FliJ family protein [Chitinivibrionales bacterium]